METAAAVPACDRRPEKSLALAVALGLTAYAALCKLLLFRSLEYTASDLYSCLGMSRSWFFSGRLLHDNAYGDGTAIHAFYLLIAFSPLTVWWGAYGLILGLCGLHALAAARAALTPALGTRGRLAVLAALLSPLAFYAFDDRGFGFHTELCYPPLALLLALALLERRPGWAALAGTAIVLVKEDGALVCAGVLIAFLLERASQTTGRERRRIVRTGLLTLAGLALVFAAGLALLWWNARQAPPGQTTSGERIERALGILARTLAPGGPGVRRAALVELCAGYAAAGTLLLLPLGRRLTHGLRILALAAAPVVAALVVSDAQYKFVNTLWPPRAATLIAVALGCLAVVAAGTTSRDAPGGRARPGAGFVLLALGLASWALQLLLLARLGYTLPSRLDALRLWSGQGYAIARFTAEDQQRWRCLGRQLPAGLPVSPVSDLYPFFHRQTIVFRGLEPNAAQPARLRVLPDADGYRVDADPDLRPALTACGWS